MALVEPIPGEPAAVADLGGGYRSSGGDASSRPARALVVADYHAGLEAGLRYSQGVELENRADERRDHLLSLLDDTDADRLVFLGDLGHAVGAAKGDERREIEALVAAVDVPVTVVKGNHDGEIESVVGDGVEVTDGGGVRLGDVGFVHGHTWPDREVLGASVICMGHEHPTIRLEDSVGGHRVERAWLRGPLEFQPFVDHYGELLPTDAELIVFPAWNDLTGGTWVNVEGQGFLAPFLPDALPDGQAYLLDGTRLGDYRRV